MNIKLMDVVGASRRNALYGLRATNPNVSQCPPCDKTNPIFYVGTAIGGIAVLGLVLKLITGS